MTSNAARHPLTRPAARDIRVREHMSGYSPCVEPSRRSLLRQAPIHAQTTLPACMVRLSHLNNTGKGSFLYNRSIQAAVRGGGAFRAD